MAERVALLDQNLILKLETLALAAKGKVKGTMQGQRRSKRMGTSLEFADYRQYSPGDDFRLLDWHAYGRTGKPFIKLFMDEQELQVHLVIDASKSMDFGENDKGSHGSKLSYAKQLAACIGYIALLGYDRVGAFFFSDKIHDRLPLLRGRGSAQRLFQFLAQETPHDVGHMVKALKHPLAVPRQHGVTWLFSDFFYSEGMEETLTYWQAAGQEVVVVQIISPQEKDPQFTGDLRLIDSELKSGIEVAMSSQVLKAYHSALHHHTYTLQRFCHDRAITYIQVCTDMELSETIFHMFRKSGMLM